MAGSRTSRAAAGLLMLALLFWGGAPLQADEAGDRLKQWTLLPQGGSGLVFIIDAKITFFHLVSEKKKLLASVKWIVPAPFVRQFRLPPGRYLIDGLPPPLAGVGIDAKEGTLTYVRLTQFSLPRLGSEQAPAVGVEASWGPVPEYVGQWLEKAYASGQTDAYLAELLQEPGGVLLVSTEPPWQILLRPLQENRSAANGN